MDEGLLELVVAFQPVVSMSHGAYRNPEAVVEQEVESGRCPHCGRPYEIKMSMRDVVLKWLDDDVKGSRNGAEPRDTFHGWFKVRGYAPLGEEYERERRKIDG